ALTLSFTVLRRRHCPYASDGAAHCGRQPPCQGAATPAVGAAAPAGDSPLRVGRWRPSLAGAPLAAAPCGLLPLRATAPCRWPAAPLQGTLAAASCPLQPATASPSSSLLLLRTR
ncbi:hypothetical protein BHM03_00041089, partial [Ensete ventricosum]